MLTSKILPTDESIIDSVLENFRKKISQEEISSYLYMNRDIFQKKFIVKNFAKIQILVDKEIPFSEKKGILAAEVCNAFMEKIQPTIQRTNEEADEIMNRSIRLHQKHV